ncbi:MAG: DUF971 domain-containing protein [Planctomycetaceae bacterium]|nr:DUF971 domain-containing protein [Planctomycetaceae bacterium]
MSATPQNLRVLSAESVLEVVWIGGGVDRFPFRDLRIACPCAACINEFTGERILDPQSGPQDVRPVGVDFAGNYGLKVVWSEGHNSGIYTWDHLHRLSRSKRT